MLEIQFQIVSVVVKNKKKKTSFRSGFIYTCYKSGICR